MNAPSTGPIVVGVDGQPGSAGAVRYAVVEARRRATALRLVHVVPAFLSLDAVLPLADLQRVGESILDEARSTVAGLAPDLSLTTMLTTGDRSSGVVNAAGDAQLVVVGRESRRGVERLLNGTVTAGIAAQARCDVVVVPSMWVPHEPHQFARCVVIRIRT